MLMLYKKLNNYITILVKHVKMDNQTNQVKIIIAPVVDSTIGSTQEKLETKLENPPQPIKRRSSRTRITRKFFHEEKYPTRKRKRRRIECDEEDNEDDQLPALPQPPTRDELRQKHVAHVTEVFRGYISDKLGELDLPLDREKTRVFGLARSLKNAISLKKKVYVSKSMGYLVSSSDGSMTYNVNPKAIADDLKYVCNCGEKYQDRNRTSCKHCGSVIFHNIDNYFTDYLTKPYQPNVHLQLHHVNKMFNKFDIDKQKPVKNMKFQPTPVNVGAENIVVTKEEDYFQFLLQGNEQICQSR